MGNKSGFLKNVRINEMFSRVLGRVLHPRIDTRKTLRHQFTNTPPLTRRYPIGLSDWKIIKQEGYFFFDKSMFLKEFYEDPGVCVLILRPRRWAKTTTWSMAKYYFNINNPQLAKDLFSGTKIENEKEFVSKTCGQFPVISISFFDCKAATWERMEERLREAIIFSFSEHMYLFETPGALKGHEQLEFERIIRKDKADFESALKKLTYWLHRYHKKRVIVLIDEYDVPINEGYIYDYYDHVLPFLSAAFTGALKDNPYLEKGLLTGVLRVAKAGYLTGLNNLRVYSLLNKRYADKYGVLQTELNEALKQEGLSDTANDVKAYYNGYSTAIPDMFLYNPWSILNYLSDKMLQPYWIETGRTDFIANAMWSSPLQLQENLLYLLKENKQVNVPFAVDINYRALDSPKTLWSLLYFSGYITGEANLYRLKARIPNHEVRRELSLIWEYAFELKGLSVPYDELLEALLSCNQKIFEKILRDFSVRLFSSHDLAREPEAFHHGFMLAVVFHLSHKGYRIESNREAGHGRSDITLYPPLGKPGVILEFKTRTEKKAKEAVTTDDDLKQDALKGLDQMETNQYLAQFNMSNPLPKSVILCSIAFVKKYVSVAMKDVALP